MARPPTFTDRQRYLVEVMYLHGTSLTEIARLMGMFGYTMVKGQIAGLINALPYRKSDMPASVRQRHLDRLKLDRRDRAGRMMALPDSFFTCKEM